MLFNIEERHAGMSIQSFLKELQFSKHQISRLKFKENGIVLNGKKARINQCLHVNDVLEINMNANTDVTMVTTSPGLHLVRKPRPEKVALENHIGEKINRLYEDDSVLVVDKPEGMVCHPSHGHWGDTVLDAVQAYLGNKEVYLIGRLDKDTSGVLLFAKNQEAATLLAKQREQKVLKKTYVALCHGVFACESGVVEVPIAKDPAHLNRMMIDKEGCLQGKEAKTSYRVLAKYLKKNKSESRDFSETTVLADEMPFVRRMNNTNEIDPEKEVTLVELEIEHGRTHQIRVHMASIGHPLVGDPIYGEVRQVNSDDEMHDENLVSFAHLHARKISFQKLFTNDICEVEASMPSWA